MNNNDCIRCMLLRSLHSINTALERLREGPPDDFIQSLVSTSIDHLTLAQIKLNGRHHPLLNKVRGKPFSAVVKELCPDPTIRQVFFSALLSAYKPRFSDSQGRC